MGPVVHLSPRTSQRFNRGESRTAREHGVGTFVPLFGAVAGKDPIMSIEITTADRGDERLSRRVGRASPRGPWQDAIDVRDFIQRNYTPYAGDAAFLVGPTERTMRVWSTLAAMFPEERREGHLRRRPAHARVQSPHTDPVTSPKTTR